jgi:hypothetical protein
VFSCCGTDILRAPFSAFIRQGTALSRWIEEGVHLFLFQISRYLLHRDINILYTHCNRAGEASACLDWCDNDLECNNFIYVCVFKNVFSKQRQLNVYTQFTVLSKFCYIFMLLRRKISLWDNIKNLSVKYVNANFYNLADHKMHICYVMFGTRGTIL